MDVPVSEAKAQLTDLVRRAEAGETVRLTRHGRVVAQIVPEMRRRPGPRLRPEVVEAIVKSARSKLVPGPDAARSQDFLYDEFGAPK